MLLNVFALCAAKDSTLQLNANTGTTAPADAPVDSTGDDVTTAELMRAFAISIRTAPAAFTQIRPQRGRYEPALYSRAQVLARLQELNGRDIPWPTTPLLRAPEAEELMQVRPGSLGMWRFHGKDTPRAITITDRGTVRYDVADVLDWIVRRALNDWNKRRAQRTPRPRRSSLDQLSPE